jgi:hypothetical protein
LLVLENIVNRLSTHVTRLSASLADLKESPGWRGDWESEVELLRQGLDSLSNEVDQVRTLVEGLVRERQERLAVNEDEERRATMVDEALRRERTRAPPAPAAASTLRWKAASAPTITKKAEEAVHGHGGVTPERANPPSAIPRQMAAPGTWKWAPPESPRSGRSFIDVRAV